LEAASHTPPGALMCGQAIQFLAIEDDGPRVMLQRATQAIYQSAFAGSIWTDQAQTLTFGNLKFQVRQRDKTSEPFT
jgi:hypothetical protein